MNNTIKHDTHDPGPIKRIFVNVGWLASSKVVGAVLSLFYLAVLARTLGPADFGVFSLILSFSQLVSILVKFESWQSLVKYGQQPIHEGRADQISSLVSLTITVDLLASALGCFLALAAVYIIAPLFHISEELQLSALVYTLVLLLALRSAPMGILRMFDRFDAGAVAETVTPIIRMIGALWALMFMPTISGFLIAWAISEIGCALTYWGLAYFLCGSRIGKLNFSNILGKSKDFPHFLRFSLASNFTSTLAVSASQAPVLLVGIFVGKEEAGLFRLGQQLANALGKISGLFSRALFTEMVRNFERLSGEPQRIALLGILRTTIFIGAVATIAIGGTVYFLGEFIIREMFGPAYLGAYSLILIMSIATSVDILGVGFEPLLQAMNKISQSIRMRIILLIILLPLMVVLLKTYAAIGGAIALLIVSIIGFTSYAALAWRALK